MRGEMIFWIGFTLMGVGALVTVLGSVVTSRKPPTPPTPTFGTAARFASAARMVPRPEYKMRATGVTHIFVTDEGSLLLTASSALISPEEAVRFGRWLVDTYAIPHEQP